MRKAAIERGLAVLAIVGVVVAGATGAGAHEGETARYILAGELVGELAYPGPGQDGASTTMRLTATPSEQVLCFELDWQAMDTPTGLTIRLGWAADGSPEDVVDEIDIEMSDGDILEEGGEEGIAIGCEEADHDPLDFIAHGPADSHITVVTALHPDGAAGGWLRLERVSGGGSPEEGAEPSAEAELIEGGGVSRSVPIVLATLLVIAATIACTLIWRRGTGSSAAPPVSGVALAASSYTVLLLGWLAMMFNRAQAANDARQLTVIGLWLALMTLLTAVVAFSTSRNHSPLRHITIVLGLAALTMAVLWLGWNTVQP